MVRAGALGDAMRAHGDSVCVNCLTIKKNDSILKRKGGAACWWIVWNLCALNDMMIEIVDFVLGFYMRIYGIKKGMMIIDIIFTHILVLKMFVDICLWLLVTFW